MTALQITETFVSVQGESSLAGYPFFFIRLTGCNLRCKGCDTTYAFEGGSLRSIDSLVEQVAQSGLNRVLVTGGEPLCQQGTPELCLRLLEAGHLVQVETNGSLDIDLLDRRCRRIVDLKAPSTGHVADNRMENLGRMTKLDELKFVLADRDDYLWARGIVEELPADRPYSILFSARVPILPPKMLADWILKDGLDVRMQLQLHKIIWPDRTSGV